MKDLLTKVQQKDNRGAGSMQDVFNVPANKCGLVIGKVCFTVPGSFKFNYNLSDKTGSNNDHELKRFH